MGWAARAGLLAAVVALVGGCATPIGVDRVDHAVVYQSLTRSALSGSTPSLFTEQFLRNRGLEGRFDDEPAAVIAGVHGTGANLDAGTLFALAEMSFLAGERTQERAHYLAAAVYALAFISSPDWRAAGITANAVDPRARLACDLYNLGLVAGLRAPVPDVAPGEPLPPPEVLLTDRTLPLPFGELTLRAAPDTFLWAGYRLSRFISSAEYATRGLRNRYRQPGLGAPLLAEVTPVAGVGPGAEVARRRIPPTIKVPVTAIVQIESVADGLAQGRLHGTLRVQAADVGRTIDINGTPVPLELDPSAAIAYMLDGSPVWDSELGGFFKATREVFGDGLVMLEPYRPGRVPVVLVHGTASSPARWAEIINEVKSDPLLQNQVQIWLFMYNTSNPILYSASLLRTALHSAIRDFDPAGSDPALRRMVMMGHSQGGLLTRLMVTESGSRFWDAISYVPFAELTAGPEERALIEQCVFFEPQPFITRVVFLATPHRGSYRVTSLVLNLVRRLVTLPIRLTRPLQDLLVLNPGAFLASAQGGLATAVDNMSPTHHFTRTLAASPIAPGVAVHSIIAAPGVGELQSRSDGVVRYASAHLEGIGSEKVVESSHSMQSHPDTILEVRRILREHLSPP